MRALTNAERVQQIKDLPVAETVSTTYALLGELRRVAHELNALGLSMHDVGNTAVGERLFAWADAIHCSTDKLVDALREESRSRLEDAQKTTGALLSAALAVAERSQSTSPS